MRGGSGGGQTVREGQTNSPAHHPRPPLDKVCSGTTQHENQTERTRGRHTADAPVHREHSKIPTTGLEAKQGRAQASPHNCCHTDPPRAPQPRLWETNRTCRTDTAAHTEGPSLMARKHPTPQPHLGPPRLAPATQRVTTTVATRLGKIRRPALPHCPQATTHGSTRAPHAHRKQHSA